MVLHHDAMPMLQQINGFMKLKPDSVGDPDIYLGVKLKRLLKRTTGPIETLSVV